jgi:uncharacterized protein YprB with RNaseH-like and TPR domain
LRYVEKWLGGEIVETPLGCHFETEKLYEQHRHHGCADIGALAGLPHDILDALSDGNIPFSAPQEWAFLDTETAGIGRTAGSCAFLVGVGRISKEGFRVRQFFMRDHAEEASVLDSLARHLASFRVMITYNGRAYDQPLLETRYRLWRRRPPFAALKHLDLLYGARHLWKLRFESCRLVDLENQILGVERQGDLPGTLIPYVYFEYLRTREAARLLPVFQHNATDILSLACLTGIVPFAFKDPTNYSLRHAAEAAGIARWLLDSGELERARTLLRRAVESVLPDGLLFRTLWDLASLERQLGAVESAVDIWNDLAGARNPFRVRALEQLAKYHEHRSKDYEKALACTRAARELEDSAELKGRDDRLSRRLKASRYNQAKHAKAFGDATPRRTRSAPIET